MDTGRWPWRKEVDQWDVEVRGQGNGGGGRDADQSWLPSVWGELGRVMVAGCVGGGDCGDDARYECDGDDGDGDDG